MLDIFLALLPIMGALSILLLSKIPAVAKSPVKKLIDVVDNYFGMTAFAMLSGTFVGLMIFLKSSGLSAENFQIIGSTCFHTITDNFSVLVGVYLLFIIVYVLKNSSVITPLNSFISTFCNTPGKLVLLLITLGVIFSIDDYLAVIAISLILAESATSIGFSKEKFSFMVNLTAVACCCLSPFSSWAPVIKSILSASGADGVVAYTAIPFNFTAMILIAVVIFTGIFKPCAFSSTPINMKHEKVKRSKTMIPSEIPVLFAVLALLISSLLLMTFVTDTEYPLIKSCGISLFFTVVVFLRKGYITAPKLGESFIDASVSSLKLSVLLLSIWLLANVCTNLLGLAEYIGLYATQYDFPLKIVPVVLFILGSVFAFTTGSAFSTFGLLLPVGVQLGGTSGSPMLQTVAIAAVLSGALMASFSFSSDCLPLIAEHTQCNINNLQMNQMFYASVVFLSGMVAFTVAPYMVNYGMLASYIPIMVSIGLLGFLFTIPYLSTLTQTKKHVKTS